MLWCLTGAVGVIPSPLTLTQAYSGLTPVDTAPLNPQQPSQGIQITYTGGVCQSAPARNFSVTYRVDCAATPGSKQVSIGLCYMVVELSDPAGCGVPLSPSGKTAPLSGGWVFIILLLVATVIYLGVGMAYKRLTVGASGVEAMPNIDFWRAFGTNISTGALWVKCTVTCTPMPNVSDDDLGYHGIRGDDYEDDSHAPPIKQVA